MLKINKYFFVLILFTTSLFAQKSNCFDVARKGTLSEITQLIKEDKNVVNSIDSNGTSMLILACYRSNDEVANFLIDNNANVNYVSENGTALMACVVKGEFELLDKLIKNGAKIDAIDKNGMTALMLAVQFNNQEMVKKLLSENANKTLKCNQNKTAFEYAVFSGNENIINLLK